MAQTRTRLDDKHPCLTCGAPWKITEQGIWVAEVPSPIGYAPLRGECSRGAGAHSIDEYNEGLRQRRKRGW